MVNHMEEKQSVKESIIAKIKSGEIKMHPRLYFVLKAALIVSVIFVVALVALYISSFVLFITRANGTWFLPRFGPPGARIFFGSLPWFLILATIVLILILEFLAKKFAIIYRRPIVYSIIGIVLIVSLGVFALDRARFHPNLFRQARQGHWPIMESIYRQPGLTGLKDAHRGVVTELTDNGFKLKKLNDEILQITTDEKTRFFPDQNLDENDVVVVMGRRTDDTVLAKAVRRLDDEFEIFERR